MNWEPARCIDKTGNRGRRVRNKWVFVVCLFCFQEEILYSGEVYQGYKCSLRIGPESGRENISTLDMGWIFIILSILEVIAMGQRGKIYVN